MQRPRTNWSDILATRLLFVRESVFGLLRLGWAVREGLVFRIIRPLLPTHIHEPVGEIAHRNYQKEQLAGPYGTKGGGDRQDTQRRCDGDSPRHALDHLTGNLWYHQPVPVRGIKPKGQQRQAAENVRAAEEDHGQYVPSIDRLQSRWEQQK